MTPSDPMASACRLCLVRHGETGWNAERRLQGHEDIPLNATGEAQAHAASQALQHQRFAALYSSDLRRAHQTALAIAAPHALPVVADARLRERHYGIFQGLTYDEAQRQHPEAYAAFLQRTPGFALPGGGESLDAIVERVATTLGELAARHPGQDILVVTHGGVLDVAYRLATGMDFAQPRDFPIHNAALNWIALTPPGWQLLSWGEPAHGGAALDELPNA